MFCSNCGKELKENSKFCNVCGAPQNTAPEVSAQPVDSEEKLNVESEPVLVYENIEETFDKEDTAEELYTQNSINEEKADKIYESAVEDSTKPVETEVKKKIKKESKGILRGIAAVLLCIFIFTFVFSGAAVLSLRSIINPENVTEIVDEFEFNDIEELVKDYNLISGYQPDTDRDLFKEVVKDSSIPEFTGEKIAEYGEYILGGDEPDEIGENEIVDLLEDNDDIADVLCGMYGYRRYYHNEIENDYESYYNEVVKPSLDSFYGDTTITGAIKTARIVLSIWILIALALIVILLIWLLSKTRRSKTAFLDWTGYTFISVGLLYLIMFLIRPLFTLCLPFLKSSAKDMVGMLLGSILLNVIIIGGSIAGAGVLMILVRKLILFICKKRKKA